MGDVNAQNLGQLRTLNEHTFPVRYAIAAHEIPTPSRAGAPRLRGLRRELLRALAFRNTEEKWKKLYIATIGVLHVDARASGKLPRPRERRRAQRPRYLHVQTGTTSPEIFMCSSAFANRRIRGYQRIQLTRAALAEGAFLRHDPGRWPGGTGVGVNNGFQSWSRRTCRPEDMAATWAVRHRRGMAGRRGASPSPSIPRHHQTAHGRPTIRYRRPAAAPRARPRPGPGRGPLAFTLVSSLAVTRASTVGRAPHACTPTPLGGTTRQLST